MTAGKLGRGIGWLIAGAFLAVLVWVPKSPSPLTQDMGLDQRPGAMLPGDDTFKDETGKTVKLASYFGQRPLLVLPIFYACKSYCGLELDSLKQTMVRASHPTGLTAFTAPPDKRILQLGRDFDVVAVSIDPRETPELATNKKAEIANDLMDPAVGNHWHMLTGSYKNIRRFTDALGFQYHYDPKTGLIRHPTCSVVVTPNGVVSSYLVGYDMPTKFLQADLALASQNQIGKKADQSFMFGCLMLDPATGKIRFAIEGVLRILMGLTAIGLALFIYSMVRQERKANTVSGLTGT